MRSVLSLSLLILLSACMGGTEEPPQVQTPVVAEPEPTPVENIEVVLPDAQLIQGHTPRDVQAALGEPSLVRRDGNVQVMLFEQPSCVLEVIFFEKNADDHFRATDINARSLRGETLEADACLASLLGDGVSLDLPSP
ncbi:MULTISPECIES: hypothetical protein [Kordiimonas]|uniref:hypothetical protein n=1 Tax=Kordiimonas TaxID=288021 RepID=UPI001FF4CF79|nr:MULTISPECIES: hypothetical protein [Kordiimonas]MCK0070263.1 hypothetical protein [Kordiimonas laminariae]UTW58972.1 hypothetical protein KFE96_01300 [Kordiimonas sp. SCSIO 12603]